MLDVFLLCKASAPTVRLLGCLYTVPPNVVCGSHSMLQKNKSPSCKLLKLMSHILQPGNIVLYPSQHGEEAKVVLFFPLENSYRVPGKRTRSALTTWRVRTVRLAAFYLFLSQPLVESQTSRDKLLRARSRASGDFC